MFCQIAPKHLQLYRWHCCLSGLQLVRLVLGGWDKFRAQVLIFKPEPNPNTVPIHFGRDIENVAVNDSLACHSYGPFAKLHPSTSPFLVSSSNHLVPIPTNPYIPDVDTNPQLPPPTPRKSGLPREMGVQSPLPNFGTGFFFFPLRIAPQRPPLRLRDGQGPDCGLNRVEH